MTGRQKETPSQTAGPYVHIGCMPNHLGIEGILAEDAGAVMVGEAARGQRITFAGTITDATGAPVRDAMVEIWQADSAGLYPSPAETRGVADPAFSGWGRVACDFESGEFRFETLKPGRVPWPDGRLQAPHITVWIVARGINTGLHTRAYFADEPEANAEDPLLARIDPPARRATLLARPEAGGVYRFDIRLQGEGETVFLDM